MLALENLIKVSQAPSGVHLRHEQNVYPPHLRNSLPGTLSLLLSDCPLCGLHEATVLY